MTPLFTTMARILWAANIEGARVKNGKKVSLDTDTLGTLRGSPHDFGGFPTPKEYESFGLGILCMFDL